MIMARIIEFIQKCSAVTEQRKISKYYLFCGRYRNLDSMNKKSVSCIPEANFLAPHYTFLYDFFILKYIALYVWHKAML